ncbi:MalY/PatB family protein [Aestuariibacter salexigens]|uniref:MalY/PatB family protein n=1 Tax=Aestuariibacter salexigens TaxID=226010 RepID=UPI0003FC46BC|nr:PatB family C-S lyase [Aestuariibacter salexigens]
MQFDHTHDRSSTYAFKWEKYKGTDILPMWVADTEFRCAEPIIESLHARVEHGLLGYTLPAQYTPANLAVASWLGRRYGWQIDPQWLVWTPGVVPAFNVACKAYCRKGDKVIVQSPNYPPLLAAPALNGLHRLMVDTLCIDDRWTLDFEQLERHASDPDCKLMILCNPMNPVGSVLRQQELDRIADICVRHNVLLCSDEIHCDLILDDKLQHLPAGAHSALAERSVTLMAASKTFNIAGLGASFAIIPDQDMRKRFTSAAAGIVPWVNVLGLVATEAAFTQCDDWYESQLVYLRDNRDYLVQQINSIDGLSTLSPEATFLLWVDGSALQTENVQSWFESKGVGPSPGADFGARQFARINFGCPKSMLEQAVQLLQAK